MNDIEKEMLLKLPKIVDFRGNLSFLEENVHVPFAIRRCYWIYDVPGGEQRGGHAYFQNREFIIALSGSFDVLVDNGVHREIYHLNRSYYGLYIPNRLWRELENFSTNSLAFVAASTDFNDSDYIRSYDQYKEIVK